MRPWLNPTTFLFCPPKMLTAKCPFKTNKNFLQLCYRVNMNSHRAQLTLLESTLPRASSLMELVTPSCRTKSTGLTTPDLEQGTLTTIIRTFFKRSSVGRASRKLSSCKATSTFVVKVKIVSNLHDYLFLRKGRFRELKRRRRRQQRKRQKTNRFRLTKQQLCTCHHALLYIS